MRRIQGLVLLAAMFSSPILALAEAIPQLTACCCSGTLCPMHKGGSSREVPRGESPFGTSKGTSQECKMSTCNPHSDSGILQSAPEAVLPLVQGLLLPGSMRISGIAAYARKPLRFVLPLEKPPRR